MCGQCVMQGAGAASGGAAGLIAALAAAASMLGLKSVSAWLAAREFSWATLRLQKVVSVAFVWLVFLAAYVAAT